MTPFDLEISLVSSHQAKQVKGKIGLDEEIEERSEILALRLQFETETSLADRVLFQSDYSRSLLFPRRRLAANERPTRAD